MEAPAALANEEEEIEISQDLYDLVSIEAAEMGCSEEEFINDALRTFLLLSGDAISDALRDPGE